MGKKSRLKKLRQETQTEELSEKQVIENKPFLLHIIRISTYLILLTPLILLSGAYFPFVGPKSLYFMAICQIIFFTWLYLAAYILWLSARLYFLLGFIWLLKEKNIDRK